MSDIGEHGGRGVDCDLGIRLVSLWSPIQFCSFSFEISTSEGEEE